MHKIIPFHDDSGYVCKEIHQCQRQLWSINQPDTERGNTKRDTVRGRYNNRLTHLWQQYNKDESIITPLNEQSSHHYWHEHKSSSFIDCSKEMNQPITQVLTVYSFIWVVSMSGDTATGPNDTFISYLIFFI